MGRKNRCALVVFALCSLGAILLITCYVQANAKDIRQVIHEELGLSEERLEIFQTESRGNDTYVLARGTASGFLELMILSKHPLWPSYHIYPVKKINKGLDIYKVADEEKVTLAIFGEKENAAYYTFLKDGIYYSKELKEAYVLDVFLIPNEKQGTVTLIHYACTYNAQGEQLEIIG